MQFEAGTPETQESFVVRRGREPEGWEAVRVRMERSDSKSIALHSYVTTTFHFSPRSLLLTSSPAPTTRTFLKGKEAVERDSVGEIIKEMIRRSDIDIYVGIIDGIMDVAAIIINTCDDRGILVLS